MARADPTEFDDKTNVPKEFTRTDGGQQDQTLNAKGQTETVSGAGLLPQRLAYHSAAGQRTGLTTFRFSVLDGMKTRPIRVIVV